MQVKFGCSSVTLRSECCYINLGVQKTCAESSVHLVLNSVQLKYKHPTSDGFRDQKQEDCATQKLMLWWCFPKSRNSNGKWNKQEGKFDPQYKEERLSVFGAGSSQVYRKDLIKYCTLDEQLEEYWPIDGECTLIPLNVPSFALIATHFVTVWWRVWPSLGSAGQHCNSELYSEFHFKRCPLEATTIADNFSNIALMSMARSIPGSGG